MVMYETRIMIICTDRPWQSYGLTRSVRCSFGRRVLVARAVSCDYNYFCSVVKVVLPDPYRPSVFSRIGATGF